MINVCLLGLLGIVYFLNSDKFISIKFRLKQFIKVFQERKINPYRKTNSIKSQRSESINPSRTLKRNMTISMNLPETVDLEKERGKGLIMFAAIFLYTLQVSMIDLSCSINR